MLRREDLSQIDLLDRILDKGIVVDTLAEVSPRSLELVAMHAHVVVTSMETHLKYGNLLEAPARKATAVKAIR